jgi:hypothetical protein
MGRIPRELALLDAPVRAVVIETEGKVLWFVGLSGVDIVNRPLRPGGRVRRCHLCVEIEEFLEALCVIAKSAADVDALENFIVSFMGVTEIVGHFVGVVKFSDRRRKVDLTGQQDVLGAPGQFGFVPFRQVWDRKSVPSKGIGVTEVLLDLPAHRSNPDQV